MCGVIDKLLPVAGGIGGFLIGGPVGAGIGAGLGGAVGNYAQTHNFGSALTAGAISGGTSYLGGELSQGLGGTGSLGPNTFSTGVAGAGANAADAAAPELAGLGSSSADGLVGLGNSADSLGSLESGLGGSSLFGTSAGTGTIGGLDSGISGGLGATDPGSLAAGVTGGNYTGALGGGTGALGQAGSTAATNGVGGTPDSSGAITPSGAPNQTQFSLEGSQAPAGTTAAQGPGGADNLSTLYGPNGTGQGSVTQTGIAGSAPQGSVTANPTNLGQSMGDDFSWTSPSTLGTLMKLGNTGLGMYQQYAQQHAQNQYANSISQMFSPNSPYAQQMQQTLARQDAAAGRNSQGGTRAVQLAAALTQAQAQAMGNSNYAHAATATPGANALNNVFAQFGNPQGLQQLGQFGSGAFNSLSSLFG